jgi:hypothetical protein
VDHRAFKGELNIEVALNNRVLGDLTGKIFFPLRLGCGTGDRYRPAEQRWNLA